jgi:hypothetical protein
MKFIDGFSGRNFQFCNFMRCLMSQPEEFEFLKNGWDFQ